MQLPAVKIKKISVDKWKEASRKAKVNLSFDSSFEKKNLFQNIHKHSAFIRSENYFRLAFFYTFPFQIFFFFRNPISLDSTVYQINISINQNAHSSK